MIGPAPSEVSGLTTLKLINREEEIRQIGQAVFAPARPMTVFYFHARGGTGKTRLLQEILENEQLLRSWQQEVEVELLAGKEPVDLYHYHTHTVDGLVQNVVRVMDAGPGYFENYEDQLQRLENVRADPNESLQEVNYQRQRVVDTFLKDYTRLTRDFRVILALDTLESLVYEREEQIISLGGLETSDVWAWLTETFLPRARNTVLLIAGRPKSQALADEMESIHGIHFETVALKPFAEEDTLEYFEAVADAASIAPNEEEEERKVVARRISAIPEEMRKVVHLYTGGRPILLALVVDYLAVTGQVMDAFQISLAEAREQTRTDEELRALRARMEMELVRVLQETGRDTDETLRALAWAPKGVDARLLAHILASEEPAESSIVQAKASLRKVRTLSFVKVRPEDERVFLHDEMYDLLEQHVLRRFPARRKEVYEAIISYYREIINQGRRELARLPASAGERRIEAERTLYAAQVETVYYRLRNNIVDGLKRYYLYADEAALAGAPELAQQLQNELIRFLRDHGEQPEVNRLRTLIEQELAIHSVKQLVEQGKPNDALERAQEVRHERPDLFESEEADTRLKVYEAWALTYQGNLDEALEQLSRATEVLSVEREDDFEEWQRQITMAYAHHLLAYCYRSSGRFQKARDENLLALAYWRDLREVEVDHSNTLNNLGWVCAELGDFQWGERYVRDALEMREELGQPLLIARSLNTLGLIRTRQGFPEQAEVLCRRALEHFRNLEYALGVGLASTALAESLRRKAAVPGLYEPAQAADFLRLAETLARESTRIFREQLPQPERLVEGYLELGCIYRDWARIRPKYEHEDDEPQDRMAEQGIRTLRKAANEAGQRYLYRRIDALVNLAWLYYYIEKPEDARQVLLEEVIPEIPEYIITDGLPQVENPTRFLWVQLGKAHALLGQISFDEYETVSQKTKNGQEGGIPNPARKHLEQAVEFWALALEYDHLFADDFRDLRAGLDRFYAIVKQLNLEEIAVVEQKGAAKKEELGLDRPLHMLDYLEKAGVKR